MRIAICPGSFDPVTYGHLDIFKRATEMFDHVIVGVFNNVAKKSLFSMEERVKLLQESTKEFSNLSIDSFEGLLPEYAHMKQAKFIVRGLRDANDFLYEFPRAMLIKNIAPDLETVFLTTNSRYYHVSSSAIRELVQFGGSITDYVPSCVEAAIIAKLKK